MFAGKPIVLILCTGNSCRSQMAEALLRKFQGDKYDVHSAGMDPAQGVHPLAIKIMAEAGIDIIHCRPKSTTEYLGRQPVRHILIVCDRASQSCPRIWPGTSSRTSMPVDDPAEATGTEEEKLGVFRCVRDELAEAMNTWEPKREGSGR
jgi:arsenate reductase